MKQTNKSKASIPELDPDYLEPVKFRRIQEGEMNTVIQVKLISENYLLNTRL